MSQDKAMLPPAVGVESAIGQEFSELEEAFFSTRTPGAAEDGRTSRSVLAAASTERTPGGAPTSGVQTSSWDSDRFPPENPSTKSTASPEVAGSAGIDAASPEATGEARVSAAQNASIVDSDAEADPAEAVVPSDPSLPMSPLSPAVPVVSLPVVQSYTDRIDGVANPLAGAVPVMSVMSEDVMAVEAVSADADVLEAEAAEADDSEADDTGSDDTGSDDTGSNQAHAEAGAEAGAGAEAEADAGAKEHAHTPTPSETEHASRHSAEVVAPRSDDMPPPGAPKRPPTDVEEGELSFRPPIQTLHGAWRGDVVEVPDMAASIVTGAPIDSDEYDAALFDLSEAPEDGELDEDEGEGKGEQSGLSVDSAEAAVDGAPSVTSVALEAAAKAVDSQVSFALEASEAEADEADAAEAEADEAEGAEAEVTDAQDAAAEGESGAADLPPVSGLKVMVGLDAQGAMGGDGPAGPVGDLEPNRLPDAWLSTSAHAAPPAHPHSESESAAPLLNPEDEAADAPSPAPPRMAPKIMTAEGVEVATEDVEKSEMDSERVDSTAGVATAHASEGLAPEASAPDAASGRSESPVEDPHLPLGLSVDVPGLAEALEFAAADHQSHGGDVGASASDSGGEGAGDSAASAEGGPEFLPSSGELVQFSEEDGEAVGGGLSGEGLSGEAPSQAVSLEPSAAEASISAESNETTLDEITLEEASLEDVGVSGPGFEDVSLEAPELPKPEPVAVRTATSEGYYITDEEDDDDSLVSAAEITTPAMAVSADPGDLPEPAARADSLQLPVAELPPELGWDISSASHANDAFGRGKGAASGSAVESGEVVPTFSGSFLASNLMSVAAAVSASRTRPGEGASRRLDARAPEPHLSGQRSEVTRIEGTVQLWDGAVMASEPEQEVELADSPSSWAADGMARFDSPLLKESLGETGSFLTLDDQFAQAVALLTSEAEDAAARLEPPSRAALLLEAGRLHLEKGNHAQALAAFDSSLALLDTFEPGLRALGALAEQLGLWGRAIDALETHALATSDAELRAGLQARVALLRRNLAMKDASAGDKALSEKANSRHSLQDLLEAHESAPDSFYVLTLLEKEARRSGNWATLVSVLEKQAQGASPDSALLLQVQAAEVSWEKVHDLGNAVRLLEQVFAARPDYCPARTLLERMRRSLLSRHAAGGESGSGEETKGVDGSLLARLEALEFTMESSLTDEGAPLSALLRAVDRSASQGHVHLAMQQLQAALDRAPLNPWLRREYQGWLARTGDWETYRRTLQQELMQASEPSIQALIHFFDALICTHSLGDDQAALASLESVLALTPDWRLPRLEQLRLLRRGGDHKRLAAVYQQLADVSTDDERKSAWLLMQGLAELGAGLSAEALASVRQAFIVASAGANPAPHFGWTLRWLLSQEAPLQGLETFLAEGGAPWPLSVSGGAQSAETSELIFRATLAELQRYDFAHAKALYSQAFERGDRSPIVVGGLLRVLERAGDHAGLHDFVTDLWTESSVPQEQSLLAWSQVLMALKSGQAVPEEWLERVLVTDFLPARWLKLDAQLGVGQLDGWQAALGGMEGLEASAQRLETLGESIYRIRRASSGQPGERASTIPLTLTEDREATDIYESYLFEIGDTAGLEQLYGKRLESLSDPSSRRFLSQRRAGWREQAGDLAGAFELLLGLAQEGVVEAHLLDWLESLAGRLDQDAVLNTHLASLLDLAPSEPLRLRLARRLEAVEAATPVMLAEARALYEAVLRAPGRELSSVGSITSSSNPSFNAALAANTLFCLEGLVRLGQRVNGKGDGESPTEQVTLDSAGRHALGEALNRLAGRTTHEGRAAELNFLAAEAFTLAGDQVAAEPCWWAALASPVVEMSAFRTLVNLCRERGDVSGLERLYGRKLEAESRKIERQCLVMELADELEALGGINFAIEHFRTLAEEERHLAACLRLERIHLAQEAWEPYVAALEARQEALLQDSARVETQSLIQRVRAERLRDPWALEQKLTGKLKEDPDNSEAFETLRALLASQERWTDLANLLEDAVMRTRPGEERAQLQLDLAWLYAHPLDDLDVAYDRYQDVLDNEIGNAEALTALKEICEQREDWNGLVATLARQSMVQTPEEQVETYRQIARLWDLKLHEPVTAMQAWNRVLEAAPGDRSALTALYDLNRRMENWTALLAVGSQLAEQLGNAEPGLLNEIGNIAIRNVGDFERGVEWLFAAGAHGRLDTETLVLAAEHLEELGEFSQCVDIYHRIIERADNPALQVECYQRIAFLNRERLNDIPAAIVAWREVLKLVPDHLAVMYAVARLQLDMDAPTEALETLHTLLQHPASVVFLDGLSLEDRVGFHRTVGQLEDMQGSKEAAVAQFEVAIQLAPADQELQGALAGLYQSLEMWDKYALLLRSLMQQEPDVSLDVQQGRLEALARAYQSAGDDTHLLDAANQLRKLVPGFMPAYRMMAEVYERQEAWSLLLDLYNAMIKHASDLADVVDAYLCKADILNARLVPTNPTYLPKAVRHYMKAVEYDRRNVYAMLQLAEISLKTLQYTQADDWLRRALALEPNPYQLAQTWLLGGILCAEVQHNQARAQAIFQKAAELSPEVATRLEALEAAIARSPGNLDALLKLFHEVLPYQR